MTRIEGGSYETDDSVEAIVNRMVSHAETYFGEDLSSDTTSVISQFYRPIAIEMATLQADIGLVLESAQIDNARGEALDLLCALINVTRGRASNSTGNVVFSREDAAGADYLIPEETVVQTESSEPVRFETTEPIVLEEGEVAVEAPVESVEEGTENNISANRLTIFEDRPAGIEDVNNPEPIDGAVEEETDSNLRARAKEELADGSGATARALLSAVSEIDDQVRSVSVEINDTASVDEDGQPPNSFELIVESTPEFYPEIAQAIMDNKAVGGESHHGLYGDSVIEEVNLPNGQTHEIGFSTPTEREIYVDASIEVEDEYLGEGAVVDSLTSYIGGLLFEGEPEAGELRAGDDVLYGEVEYAIRDVPGVFDVTDLKIGLSNDPDGVSNISIDKTDIAILNGNEDEAVSIDTTDV